MKRQLLLSLTLSVLAANAFALPLVAPHNQLNAMAVAESGSDRTGANRIAADGSDHTGANRIAESGADRTGANRIG